MQSVGAVMSEHIAVTSDFDWEEAADDPLLEWIWTNPEDWQECCGSRDAFLEALMEKARPLTEENVRRVLAVMVMLVWYERE
jgi:hypothetical protein